MKFGGKDFKDYWKIIKIPTLVLVAWAIVGFIVAVVSFSTYMSIFTPLVGWLLLIVVFGFIGWITIDDFKGTIGMAAWGGALSGAISGLVGAVIGILMFYFVPAIIEVAVSQAVSQGASAEMVESFMSIGVYIGVVTGPLVSGVIGAVISALSALVAKNLKFK